MNQCDGCRRGLPLWNGIHHGEGDSWDAITCTADRYEPPKRKWRVSISRAYLFSTVVEIEADTASDAQDLAEANVDDYELKMGESLDDCATIEVYGEVT